MPLPPLPPNNTITAWLGYTSVGFRHEMQFRCPSGTSTSSIIGVANALAGNLKSRMRTTDSFLDLKYRAAGSIVSLPLAFTAQSGTSGASVENDDSTKFFAVSGRSNGGYRVKMTFFCPTPSDAIGYRQGRTAGNEADSFLTTVEAFTASICAVDGLPVVWHQYANFGYNAYWQRQMR